MFAAVLAALSVLAPPNHGDAICDGREPTQAEQREDAIRGAQGGRSEFGLPTGRAHVIAVLSSTAARRRARQLQPGFSLPVTAAEFRYMREAQHIDGSFGRVAHYLSAREGAISGGYAFVYDWPRLPYMAVYVKRDVARIQAAVERRADFRIRVFRVRHSERDLRRRERAIDDAALKAVGITIDFAYIDNRHNAVALEVTSARPDAARVIRARYGRDLRVFVSPPPPAFTDICLGLHQYSADGTRLTIHYETDSTNVFGRVQLTETPTAVTVGVIVRKPGDPSPFGTGALRTVDVQLAAPLGTRPVLDAETGRTLSQITGSA